MTEPLVSIVMAAYNEELYIGEAISSVLNQTFLNFEFIIINDGSTDETERVILSFRDSRIKYIKNQVNIKLIDSLNKGIEAARGKYIARMDSDDVCNNNRLSVQVNFMENNPEIGISGTHLNIFGDKGGKMIYPLTFEEIKLNLFITSSFGNNVVIFRRNLLQKYNLIFPKGYLHAEDYKCWCNWVFYTKAQNLDLYLVNYRSHNNSISIVNSDAQKKTRNRIRIEYLTKVFQLEDNKQIALDFYGNLGRKRLKATKAVININDKLQLFSKSQFKNTIFKLWYLDGLEEVEKTPIKVLFTFALVFEISIVSNIKNWFFVIKHFIKLTVK